MDTLTSDELAEAAALLTLLRIRGIADATTRRLVERFGSGRDALAAPHADFAEVAGAAAAGQRGDPAIAERVERGLEWCHEKGVAVRVRGRPGYPEPLEDLPDPPAVVLLRGREELIGRPSVGVVGSRKSTAAGRRAADEIAAALAGAGIVTVSGLAVGIDAAAHRAVLAAGGDTIGVLGTGPDVVHPPSNGRLFERIAREGLLVSEFLPGEPAFRYHFPRRNRVLAALSGAIVVVEAAERSGALITANHALDLGRPIGAVPGSIYSPGSVGTNRLIRDGAHPVLEPADALDLLGSGLGGMLRVPAPRLADPPGDPGRVWRALGDVPRTVDELARASALPAARVMAALSELELGGRLVREAGARFRRGG